MAIGVGSLLLEHGTSAMAQGTFEKQISARLGDDRLCCVVIQLWSQSFPSCVLALPLSKLRPRDRAPERLEAGFLDDKW